MIKTRLGMIPRYNWDYGLSDYAKALASIFKSKTNHGTAFQNLFGQEPIFTASGRTSLYSILKGLNLPEKSFVGVPLFCCPVVFDAIRQAGLVPKFIDINLDDYNLSASDLERKREYLSALVVVHMFGHPADMDTLAAIAGDIPVVEDCAQSLFSTYKGKYTGFLSTASFFSFRSGKYLSAGEGSAIFAKDPSLAKAIRDLVETYDKLKPLKETVHCTSTYIKSRLYNRPWYGAIGYPIGMLLDRKLNLTAKTGFELGKIARTDLSIINERILTFLKKIEIQRENALYFLKNLTTDNIILPEENEHCRTNYYQFAIRFKDRSERQQMANYLFRQGIDTAQYLDDIVQHAGHNYDYAGDCPSAEHSSNTVLIIPNHYTLSHEDLDKIIESINYFLSSKN